MDLHTTSDLPTPEECAALDRAIVLPPGEAKRSSLRHLLLPALHALQDAVGWISPGGLNEVSRRLAVPPAEAFGVASFYALFSTKPQAPTVLHVCDDIACKTLGADSICSALSAIAREGETAPGLATCWKRSPCLGQCDRAPAAFLQSAGDPPTLQSLRSTTADELTKVLLERAGDRSHRSYATLAHRGELLRRTGVADPESLADYRASGGYLALKLVLERGPEWVIEEVTRSKLSGRGGAAFPTGVKWKAVANAIGSPKYVVCNADESEPGTFKDRLLMEEDPFAVIEALTIAGFGCGAEKGWIYIRGEYPIAAARLRNAIDQAEAANLLGASILGTGFSFDVEIRRGGGAYICGEETALLNSIEGKRGEPRNKPPFPVHFGLFGKPTAVNNVETLVNVLPIVTRGAEEFLSTGTEGSPGTRLFCVSGCVEKPGVYESEHGIALGDLIELAGGVRGGAKLQAVLLGGAAGVFVGPEQLGLRLTLEDARAAGATLGSGVVMVFDESEDLRSILLRIAAFFRDESCGQCVPCRVGAVRQEETLHRLFATPSQSESDVALLAELEQVMKDASICGLGHTASSAIRSGLRLLGR